ncbi:ParA family protein [Micromonospora nigra]|nr:ParA family protein [Micromonospora nigra]
MRVLTTVNLKGGSGKTTTAAYLAHAFADRGRRPIIVDADPQGSAVRWQELGGWPLPAVALPSTTLHRQLAGVVDRNRFDLVVIDTPPLEDRHGIVVSALARRYRRPGDDGAVDDGAGSGRPRLEGHRGRGRLPQR